MRSARIFWFMMSLVIGLAGGLVYGWVVRPLNYTDVSARQLRSDYRVDYVLMTAEVFAKDGDPAKAADQLSFLGNEPVIRYVQQAIIEGSELGYARADLDLMGNLAAALQNWMPLQGGGGTP
ncbi:MAG: hypothetical protein GYA48_15805 [Chloroflexi bacterium]|nr:hypothetical protein [Chloroflexota bacterium]